MTGKDKSLQERLRENDKTALDYVYTEYKDAFINFALRYEIDYYTLEDIYQDSVIALYQSFVVKQMQLKSSSVKTYLFGIGKNIIYNRIKTEIKTLEVSENHLENFDDTFLNEPTQEQLLLNKHFNTLSESCQEILRLFYYRGLRIEEIVQKTEYKDQNTVKSHKSRCLKGLKNKIANN